MASPGSHMRCLDCGYILEGLPAARCPECGRAFDPEDRSTYNDDDRVAKWRLWAKPPSIWHALAAIAVTLLVFEQHSRPYGVVEPEHWVGPCCILFLTGPVLVMIYGFHLESAWKDRLRAARDQATASQRRRWRWFVLPVCCGLVVAMFAGNWPMRLRFALSKAALEAEAQKLLARHGTASAPPRYITHDRLVGLYYVRDVRIESSPRRVIFFVTPALVGQLGFGYAPAQPVPTDPGWYVVEGWPPGWYIAESGSW